MRSLSRANGAFAAKGHDSEALIGSLHVASFHRLPGEEMSAFTRLVWTIHAKCRMIYAIQSPPLDSIVSDEVRKMTPQTKSQFCNCWDNAAMKSFFSSLKTERIKRKVYRSRDQARADVFDYIERFYNPTRRHSTLDYLSPMDFERQAGVA